MAARRAFVLNLDAELELAATHAYAPTRAVRAATEAHARVVAKTLVPPDDAVVDETTPPGALEGARGLAWCPTPSAVVRLRRAGAHVEAPPSMDVLRRVMRRDFAYDSALPGARVHTDPEAALAHLREPSAFGRGHRLKRVFGMSGRGHRVVTGAPTAADEAFVRASAPALIVEPEVAISHERALHGFLHRDGALERGEICAGASDTRGAFVGMRAARADEARRAEDDALHAALERAAAALREAGYHGPFGVDAFAYEGGFRACSEINARYSMGWAIGFAAYGDARPDLVAR